MEVNWQYLAGFFDGEGSIGVYNRNTDRTGTIKYYVLVVSLAQSGDIGERICTYLKENFGGSIYCQLQENRKPQWKWNVSANKAGHFLQQLAPHLYIKKAEAKAAIKFQGLKCKRDDDPIARKFAEEIKQMKVNY